MPWCLEAKHVVIDGQHFAEVEGHRYPMEEVNGQLGFREEVALEMAERHAGPEGVEAVKQIFRLAKSETPSVPRTIQ